MAIVFQHDKRSNITYVYESEYWWDKEKKQSRSKRKLIGKIDKESGEIVPTDGRNRKSKEKTKDLKSKRTSVNETTRKFYGATYLLDKIGQKLGIVDDLKACFPDQYEKILSVAYYLITEAHNPLSRFEKWHHLHKHPYGKIISSQRSSELFASITEAQKENFFIRQGKRRKENEYWAYDIKSISSYSQRLKQVQYGNNKENDNLAQINLALVFGEESGLPFYYRPLAGNIPDVKTVKKLLSDLNDYDFKKVKLVMDRGFYSKENVNMLMSNHIKFLIGTKRSLSFVKSHLEPMLDTFRDFEHYDDSHEVYFRTVTSEWDYEQQRPYKGEIKHSKKRVYLHYYYNIDQAAEDEKNFDKRLMQLKREIESNSMVKEHEKSYSKYFEIKKTPKRGSKAILKKDVVSEIKKYYGYFVLMSNEKMSAIEALNIYRTKDIVEKGFNNIKESLNCRRTLVSSDRSLNGKLFVEFISLIYLSYINKMMRDKGMYKDYTLQEVIDKLDLIECFERSGHNLQVGEILSKQKELYKLLEIQMPTSL